MLIVYLEQQILSKETYIITQFKADQMREYEKWVEMLPPKEHGH